MCVCVKLIYISMGRVYSLSRNIKKINYRLLWNKSRPFVRREILNIHTTHLIELSRISKYLSNINSFFFPSIEHRCDRSRFSSGYPKPYDKKTRPKTCTQAIAQKNIIKVFKFHEIFLAGGKTFSLFTDLQHSPFSLNTQSSFWKGLSLIQYWRKLDSDVTFWWAWSLILLKEGFNKLFFTTVFFIFSSLGLTERPRVGYDNYSMTSKYQKWYTLNKQTIKLSCNNLMSIII